MKTKTEGSHSYEFYEFEASDRVRSSRTVSGHYLEVRLTDDKKGLIIHGYPDQLKVLPNVANEIEVRFD